MDNHSPKLTGKPFGMRKLIAIFLSSTLLAFSGYSCGGSSIPQQTGSDVLDNIPENASGRFIVKVITAKEDGDNQKHIQAVVKTLQQAGAENVDKLEGSSIIFVTGPKSSLEAAVQSGLIDSVQVDRISKPYKK